MPKRVRLPRVVQAGILIIVFLACVITYRSIARYDVFYVAALRLNVRSEPRPTADYVCSLSKGDRVFYQGQSIEQGGYRWMKVFQLFRPENANLDDIREGWTPGASLSGQRYLEHEGGISKKSLAVRNLLKWKIRVKIRWLVTASPFLHSLFNHIHYSPDKILHILVMMSVSSALFLTFLLLFGTKWATLCLALLTSNLLGLLNEVVDHWSGTSDFELKDILANGIGSAVILSLFFIVWSAWERLASFSFNRKPIASKGEEL